LRNQYCFVTRWRVRGTCGEVADILGDPLSLARWWPSVYLEVERLPDSAPRGVGSRVRLRTKGWLPYTIEWALEVVESHYPRGFVIVATGDFDGSGVWTFEQDGEYVDAVYDWRLNVEKPLLKRLSFALRPLFEANHRWAMRQGEESLRLELARRRATSDTERAAIPAPPGPVTYSGVALAAAVVLVGGSLAYLVGRARKKR
jgi:hypothetical protein